MTIVKTPKINKNDANFPIQQDPGPRLKYTEKSPISRQYVSLFIASFVALCHVGEKIRGGGLMALCEGGVGWPWSGGGATMLLVL